MADKPKFKVGDRVVVSDGCTSVLGDKDHAKYQGKHGEVMHVFTYNTDSPTDYDVYIDDFPHQHNLTCPAFDEEWLVLETPNGN